MAGNYNDRHSGDRPGDLRRDGGGREYTGYTDGRGSFGSDRSFDRSRGIPAGREAPGPGMGPGGPGKPSTPTLPQDYLDALKAGYYRRDPESGRNVLRREYIYGYPARIVRSFDGRNADKSSQVRKFYDYVLRIRDKLETGASFGEVEADFCMLAAFVNNAKERRTVSENFSRFIRANVGAVHSKEDLAAFARHFEAVIAYLKK